MIRGPLALALAVEVNGHGSLSKPWVKGPECPQEVSLVQKEWPSNYCARSHYTHPVVCPTGSIQDDPEKDPEKHTKRRERPNAPSHCLGEGVDETGVISFPCGRVTEHQGVTDIYNHDFDQQLSFSHPATDHSVTKMYADARHYLNKFNGSTSFAATWEAGSIQEVCWNADQDLHAGWHSYRLMSEDLVGKDYDGTTELAFQQHSLEFASNQICKKTTEDEDGKCYEAQTMQGRHGDWYQTIFGLGEPYERPKDGTSAGLWSRCSMVKIPDALPKGNYVLSWTWYTWENTQAWQSCTDIKVAKAAETTTPKPDCFQHDTQYDSHKPGNANLESGARKVTDAQTCQDTCKATEGCKCFTWNGGNNRCWLMTSCVTPSSSMSHVSGNATCDGSLPNAVV